MLSELKKERMLARILRLAKMHGPFVRFYPEGTEGTESDDGDALDVAIEEGEKAERTPEEQSKIDKSRRNEQLLEQEQANSARANEAARQAQDSLESAKTANEQLKEQLAAAEAKAAEAGIGNTELDESDYEGTDLAMVKSIKALDAKIKAKDARIAGLEKKAMTYEQQQQQEIAIQQRNSAYEELLADLDTEYGTDCRNDAVKKFQELSAKGKVTKGNPAKATRIMEKCYKEVKAAKEKVNKDKSSLSLDSGSGGGNAPSLSGVKIKAGSLDDVQKQYAAATTKG